MTNKLGEIEFLQWLMITSESLFNIIVYLWCLTIYCFYCKLIGRNMSYLFDYISCFISELCWIKEYNYEWRIDDLYNILKGLL
jgi:hypothetical protein